MKTTCDFCKTEYNLSGNINGAVKCAVCGHTWVVRSAPKKNAWLMFIASVCALLAAIVFVLAVMTHHQATNTVNQPLVAVVDDVHSISDAMGVPHFVVSGRVINQSDEIYGVPDLVVLSYDADGRVIGRQRFMSPASLLDAGAVASFSHTLSGTTDGVKNVTVEFQNQGEIQ